MHRRDVRPVEALVDLGAIEAPRLHAQRHVRITVVVVVEGRAFAGRIEDTQSDGHLISFRPRERTESATSTSLPRSEQERPLGCNLSRRRGGARWRVILVASTRPRW